MDTVIDRTTNPTTEGRVWDRNLQLEVAGFVNLIAQGQTPSNAQAQARALMERIGATGITNTPPGASDR